MPPTGKGVLFPYMASQTAEDMLGFPPRQFTALAVRYEDAIPRTYREIAARLGINRMTAWRLVHKGEARLRALGINVNTLTARVGRAA